MLLTLLLVTVPFVVALVVVFLAVSQVLVRLSAHTTNQITRQPVQAIHAPALRAPAIAVAQPEPRIPAVPVAAPAPRAPTIRAPEPCLPAVTGAAPTRHAPRDRAPAVAPRASFAPPVSEPLGHAVSVEAIEAAVGASPINSTAIRHGVNIVKRPRTFAAGSRELAIKDFSYDEFSDESATVIFPRADRDTHVDIASPINGNTSR